MRKITPCLCGTIPEIERKIIDDGYGYEIPVEKWRCHYCHEKELPFLDARERGGVSDCEREWNRIALKPDYRKRTLEYNIHGVCIDKPFKIFEWRNKKDNRERVKITVYLDNGTYYYCYDYFYGACGSVSRLWIGDTGYQDMKTVKEHAMKSLVERNKEIAKIVMTLLFSPIQEELF